MPKNIVNKSTWLTRDLEGVCRLICDAAILDRLGFPCETELFQLRSCLQFPNLFPPFLKKAIVPAAIMWKIQGLRCSPT